MESGATVHGYDARDRVGGRTLTVELGPNMRAEMGAEWIDADMKRVISWLDSVNITPVSSGGEISCLWIGDEWAEVAEDWPDVANFEEMIDKASESIPVSSWGETPIRQLFAQAGLTPRAQIYADMYCKYHFGEEPEMLSISAWYGEGTRVKGSLSAYRVKEGFQEAVRRTLQGIPVFLNWTAKRTDQGLVVTNGVETRRLDQYDRVILALPLPQILELTGVSSVASFKGDSTLKMARIAKLALGFTHPWWLDCGWNGQVMADKVFQQIYPQQDRPILCCFIAGNDAENLYNSADPISEVLDILALRYPSIKDHFVSGKFICWTHDVWTKGGFAFEAAGRPLYTLQELEDLAGASICGEFAAGEWIGYVEGALKTAETAVSKVLTRTRL